MWKALALVALSTHGAASDPKPGSCEATAQKHAKSTKLVAYKPPAECTTQGGVQEPTAVTKESKARPFVTCKDPKTKFGVDFAKQQLIVTARSMSPAQVGIDVYDDGKVITFVSRDRSPCKNAPRPMPSPNETFVYPAKAGARTFTEASCTVPTKCL